MVVLMLGDFILELLFVYQSEELFWTFLNGGLLALVFFFALLAGRTDPGFLHSPKRYGFGQMLEAFPPFELCPTCGVVVTARSRHCAYCRRCVERYDHHCPWINNCVGLRNHYLFVLFIASVFALLLVKIVMICRSFKGNSKGAEYLTLVSDHKSLTLIVRIAILCAAAFFISLVAVLNLVHCTNFMLGKTTNERFAVSKRVTAESLDEELRTVSSKGSRRTDM